VKKMLWSVVMSCVLGCTGTGDGSGEEGALSVEQRPGTDTPQGGEQPCPEVCSPYDPTDCRPVCPTGRPDAAVPEDPYADPGAEPRPSPVPVDAGAPSDPYALGEPTDGHGAGHHLC